ncbi:unnamed protein product, partial [Discosporangium mesarthrocarpum]
MASPRGMAATGRQSARLETMQGLVSRGMEGSTPQALAERARSSVQSGHGRGRGQGQAHLDGYGKRYGQGGETDSDGSAEEGDGEEAGQVSHRTGGGRNSDTSSTETSEARVTMPSSVEEVTNQTRKKLRRACDYCTQKKVRCDGQKPCSQCQRRELQCKFSICQRSGPSGPGSGNNSKSPSPSATTVPSTAKSPNASASTSSKTGVAGPAASASAVGSGGVTTPLGGSAITSALTGGGITSKADVTFLNFFLKEFNAFVPLTTQNILRDALSPNPRGQAENLISNDEDFRRQNARVAVIRGCIAIGALMKGEDKIQGYMRQVREALTHCFDFVSFETMSAYMVVAYCQDLLGNATATRNYMEFAKAIATQLPQITVDSELVFQFCRVCSEIHNCTLCATPKLLQQPGSSVPCYQVLNVLTYALYDLAHISMEEAAQTVTHDQVMAELESLLPILLRADKMSLENSSSFGALGVVLIKATLAYVLLRLRRHIQCLEV